MIYEEDDELNHVKQFLKNRYLANLRSDEIEYDEGHDEQADAEMQTVIGLLENANSDLYNIVFTINEEKPIDRVSDNDGYDQESVNEEATEFSRSQAESRSSSHQSILDDAEDEEVELKNIESIGYFIGDEDDDGDKPIDDGDKQIEETKETIEYLKDSIRTSYKNYTTELPVVFNMIQSITERRLKAYDQHDALLDNPRAYDLSDTRSTEKLNHLKKLEAEIDEDENEYNFKKEELKGYGADLEDYHRVLITKRRQLADQREALEIKSGVTTGGAYAKSYRNLNAYVNFSQYVYNVAKNLHKVNKIFKNGLINHIGYVEQDTLNDYRKSYEELEEVFLKFDLLTNFEGEFYVYLKEGATFLGQNKTEFEELKRRVDIMTDELEKLNKNDEYIRQNYNFKNKSIKKKKIAYTQQPVKPILYDDEDM